MKLIMFSSCAKKKQSECKWQWLSTKRDNIRGEIVWECSPNLQEGERCPLQETLCIANFSMKFLWGENDYITVRQPEHSTEPRAAEYCPSAYPDWYIHKYKCWHSHKQGFKQVVTAFEGEKNHIHTLQVKLLPKCCHCLTSLDLYWPSVKLLEKLDFLRCLKAQKHKVTIGHQWLCFTKKTWKDCFSAALRLFAYLVSNAHQWLSLFSVKTGCWATAGWSYLKVLTVH